MDLDIQRRSVCIRYDGTPLWPAATVDGEAVLANFSVPRNLPYRRLWCAVFAIPDSDGEPTFSSQLIARNSAGSEQVVMEWVTNYQTPSLPDQNGWNDALVQFRPPFGVTQEAGDPDKSSAPHAGACDARVAQWIHYGTPNSNVRLTMFPMEFTAGWEALRLRIFGFSLNGAKNPSGNIYAATMIQSQLRPY